MPLVRLLLKNVCFEALNSKVKLTAWERFGKKILKNNHSVYKSCVTEGLRRLSRFSLRSSMMTGNYLQ